MRVVALVVGPHRVIVPEAVGQWAICSHRRSGLDNDFGLTVAATYPMMRGERLRFSGDWSQALAAFDEASRLARGSESIHNYLGTVFGRQGDYARAIREFETALRIMPVSVRSWNNLALARRLAGDAAGARGAWERSLALKPDQPDVLRDLRRLPN